MNLDGSIACDEGMGMYESPQEPESRRQEVQRQSARLRGSEEVGKKTSIVKASQAQVAVIFVVGIAISSKVLMSCELETLKHN